MDRFTSIGVIRNLPDFDESKLSMFLRTINDFKQNLNWSRSDLVKLFHEMIPILVIKKLANFWIKECRSMTRLFDIIISSLALITLIPLLGPLALLLICTGEGKVFYKQKRIGRGKKTFNLLKFATMLEDSPNLPGGGYNFR